MRILKSIIMIFALMATMAVNAQTQTPITSVHGSVSDDMGPLMGATVCEIDGNGRIIESTITDLNGNFTMRVRNPKDRIRFSYVGMKTITQAINKTTFKISMQSATQLKEVTIKSQRRVNGNGLPIPQREVANATQTFSMKGLKVWPSPLLMRLCRAVSPVWISSVTLVTWGPVLPCVCVVLRPYQP